MKFGSWLVSLKKIFLSSNEIVLTLESDSFMVFNRLINSKRAFYCSSSFYSQNFTFLDSFINFSKDFDTQLFKRNTFKSWISTA
jgi:hypothetical protein